MATKTSERIIQMKQQFMTFHNKGWTITEIAEHFHVTTRSIYYNLQEIADSNHVSRQSLLATPHKKHETRIPKALKLREEVDPKKLTENFENMIENAKSVVSKIDIILASEQEENKLC